MFVAFEGIDGSGKTTLSNRVAESLALLGLRVRHVRENGRYASATSEAIRQLGRDTRNVALTPEAELLLYAAREAQLLEEVVRPALDLDRTQVVISDRCLHSPEVLARYGRKLPEDYVAPIVRTAWKGIHPDLVILVDVDPHIARARKRVAKLANDAPKLPSRKSLSGAGLLHRLRAGYRAMAAADPVRWIVVDNTDADLESLVSALTRAIATGVTSGRDAARARALQMLPVPTPAEATVQTPGEALDALLRWVDARAVREPDLAGYHLSGLFGLGVDQRRFALADVAPRTIATGLHGLTDPASWSLRTRLLPRSPRDVARSLGGEAASHSDAYRLRYALASIAPSETASSLEGQEGTRAWSMREDLYGAAPDAVIRSLKHLSDARAWSLRHRYLTERGGSAALTSFESARVMCESTAGLDNALAWAVRVAAREAAPIAALASLRGLTSDRAWSWRFEHVDRAPRAVMETLFGVDERRAWVLRNLVAADCKEAIESVRGLATEEAWRFREAHQDRWPSTVVKSLGPLAATDRGQALVKILLRRYPRDVSLWKHAGAAALAEIRHARACA